MKTEAEWKKLYPVSLGNITNHVIEKIQNDAYNQCLLDLMKEDLILDKAKTYHKFQKS